MPMGVCMPAAVDAGMPNVSYFLMPGYFDDASYTMKAFMNVPPGDDKCPDSADISVVDFTRGCVYDKRALSIEAECFIGVSHFGGE